MDILVHTRVLRYTCTFTSNTGIRARHCKYLSCRLILKDQQSRRPAPTPSNVVAVCVVGMLMVTSFPTKRQADLVTAHLNRARAQTARAARQKHRKERFVTLIVSVIQVVSLLQLLAALTFKH